MIWEGKDYYKRQARLRITDTADGPHLIGEFFSDEAWHNIPAYTFNFHYIMEQALLDRNTEAY